VPNPPENERDQETDTTERKHNTCDPNSQLASLEHLDKHQNEAHQDPYARERIKNLTDDRHRVFSPDACHGTAQ
jgi:hypothetical protein